MTNKSKKKSRKIGFKNADTSWDKEAARLKFAMAIAVICLVTLIGSFIFGHSDNEMVDKLWIVFFSSLSFSLGQKIGSD